MRSSLLALALTVAVTARAQAPSASPTFVGAPLTTFKIDTGAFIDDPFDVRGDGAQIAYLTTDGASPADLHLARVAADKPEVTIKGLPGNIVVLRWVGEGRVLVITRDEGTQQVTGQIYTASGPAKEKLGPTDDIELATVQGKPVIVTFSRKERKGGADVTLQAFSRETLKPVAKKLYREDGEGRITHKEGAFKVLWWYDGYAGAAVQKAGEYDKAKDIRRPDRFARLDAFKGTLSGENEIEDLLAFTQLQLEHKKHEGQDLFVRVADDRRKLYVVDGLTERELTLARPLELYDLATLAYQLLPDGRLAMSLTVDPTNSQALAHKRADPDDLDLYVIDRASYAATRVLTLPGQGRPSEWRIGGGRLGLLRKSKGFDRGGVQLEVYELADAHAAR